MILMQAQSSPEGELIARALEERRPGLSARKAAAEVPISEGRWRQIVNGRMSLGRGLHAPVVAPPETLAKMARVARVTPDELREVGREDAADHLEGLSEAKESRGDVVQAILDDPDLLPEAKEHLVNQYGLLLRVQAMSRLPDRDVPDTEGPGLRAVARRRRGGTRGRRGTDN